MLRDVERLSRNERSVNQPPSLSYVPAKGTESFAFTKGTKIMKSSIGPAGNADDIMAHEHARRYGTSFAFRTRRSQNMTGEPLFIGAFNHS